MAEPVLRRRWIGRIAFVALCLFILFTHLIPLETVPPSFGGRALDPIDTVVAITGGGNQVAPELVNTPARWIAPDLMLLITLAWVARRPSFAPILAIAAIFFLADLFYQRPPGLWTALVLILSETLRARSKSMRTLPFGLEWATVAGGIVLITAIERFTLSMVLVPQASLGLTLTQLTLTILCYPLVVFASYALFGVSRPAPGEVDELGHRV